MSVTEDWQRGKRKLTEEEVRDIKYGDWEGWTQKEIGEHFGITQGAVCKIQTGITWKHV